MANTALTKITAVISVIGQAPGTVFTSLIFFVTYVMDPISSSVKLHRAGKAFSGQTI